MRRKYTDKSSLAALANLPSEKRISSPSSRTEEPESSILASEAIATTGVFARHVIVARLLRHASTAMVPPQLSLRPPKPSVQLFASEFPEKPKGGKYHGRKRDAPERNPR